MGKKIENMLSNKKTSQQLSLAVSHEKEQQLLNMLLNEDELV